MRRGGNSDLARGGLLMNTRIERDRRTAGAGGQKDGVKTADPSSDEKRRRRGQIQKEAVPC